MAKRLSYSTCAGAYFGFTSQRIAFAVLSAVVFLHNTLSTTLLLKLRDIDKRDRAVVDGSFSDKMRSNSHKVEMMKSNSGRESSVVSLKPPSSINMQEDIEFIQLITSCQLDIDTLKANDKLGAI